MEVTELGIVTEVKPVQPEKAEPPIEVIELGIATEVKPLQPEKADPLIETIPSLILIDVFSGIVP